MKKLLFIFLTILFSIRAEAQLQSGVYTYQHLASIHKAGYYINNCYDWETQVWSNCFPYVTGMDIYMQIDSITGPVDSAMIWNSPNNLGVYVHAGDSFLLTAASNDFYWYYLATGSIYLSYNAVGMPAISGEPYYCYFTFSVAVFVDGCVTLMDNGLAGGGGPLDPTKGCSVDGPMGVYDAGAGSTGILLVPNPSDGKFISQRNGMIEVTDIAGKRVTQLQSSVCENCVVDLSFLSDGVYFVTLRDKEGSCSQKIMISK